MTMCSVLVAFLLILLFSGFSLPLQQDLTQMSRSELQFIAKMNGIKANGKNSEILAQLEEHRQSLVFVSLMPTNENKVLDKEREKETKKRELLQQQAVQAERTAKVAMNDLNAALEALQEANRRYEEALVHKEEVEIRIQQCKEEIKALDNYRKRRESEVRHTQLVAKRKRDAIEQINNRFIKVDTTQQQNNHQTIIRESTIYEEDTMTELMKTVQHVVQGTQQLIDRVAQNVKNVE